MRLREVKRSLSLTGSVTARVSANARTSARKKQKKVDVAEEVFAATAVTATTTKLSSCRNSSNSYHYQTRQLQQQQ